MTSGQNGNQPPLSSWASGDTRPAEEARVPEEAPNVEGYKVSGLLGYGGMGTVWSAVQLSTRRQVALKLLERGSLGSEKARARFEREVKLTARLQHPNIAAIYDSGVHQSRYYYAMEFVDGVPLDKYVEEHHLTQRQTLELMQTVCEAVQHAHQSGVIHRDLKPSNILVTPDGQPHVLDFGLAKAFLEGDSELSLTDDGVAAGTPAYMSPEQAAGHLEQIDTRTDVYSLGVILFRILTGKPPHDLSGTAYEVLHRIMQGELRRPRAITKDVGKELEALLLKALAHKRQDRYSTAGALAQDIENYLTAEPLTARPPSPIYFLRKRIKKHRVPIAIAFASAAATIAAMFLLAGRQEPTAREKMLAVLPFENLGSPDDEHLADGFTEEILSNLARLSGLSVISRTSAMQYKNTGKSLAQIGAELGVDHVLRGTIRWDKSVDLPRVRINPELTRVSDRVDLWADKYDVVTDRIFEVQSSIALQVVKALNVVLLESERDALGSKPTENLEAYDYYLRGLDYYNRSIEEDDVRNAVRMFEKAVELDPAFAQAYARLTRSHLLLYHLAFDRTEKRLAKAKEAVDRAFELRPDLPETHWAMGYYYYQARLDYDRALKHFRIALKKSKGNGEVFHAIAAVQRRQGHFDQAVANFKKAVRLDPRFSRPMIGAGETYELMGNFREAERYYARIISMHPDLDVGYLEMARLYLRWEGDIGKARKVLEKAPPEVLSSEQPSLVRVRILIEMFDGNYQAALECLSRVTSDALDHQMFFIPKDHLRAEIYGLMSDSKMEESCWQSAVSLLKPLVEQRPEDERLHSALGIAYAGLGRKDEAIREGKRAVELLPVTKEAWRGLYRVRDLAWIYAMVGEQDEAIRELDFLFSRPGGLSFPLLRLHPIWKPLHDHPRFPELLRKYDAFRSVRPRSS